MPPPMIIALADEVHAYLERGDLADLGPVELPDGPWEDAELVTRIVLADVAHCAEVEANDGLGLTNWDGLAEQLRCLLWTLHHHDIEYGAHLRRLTRQLPAILWSTDADLQVTTATGADLTLWGRRPSGWATGSVRQFFETDHPDSSVIEAHRRALKGENTHFEYCWAGTLYMMHVAPFRGADGAIIGTLGAAVDVTETKRAERACHEAEERFRVALRGSPIIICGQDLDLRYTYIYNTDHGFSPEAIVGKTEEEINPPEAAALLTGIKRKVLRTGAGTRQEVRIVILGEPAFYDLTVEPARDSNGEIVGVTCAAANITPLRLAEQALAEREAQLAEAQRIAHVGSWDWDVAGDRVTWSDEQYRIWGLHPTQFTPTAETVLEHLHPEDRAQVKETMDSAYRAGSSYECEHRIIRLDGAVRYIHALGAVQRNELGEAVRMHGTAQDITERRQAEEERAVQRERQARLDGMLFAARELTSRMNANLAVSTGVLDRLRPQDALGPQLQDVVDTLAARISRVTGDVAELERLLEKS